MHIPFNVGSEKSEFQISLKLPENITQKTCISFCNKIWCFRIIDTDDDNFPDISEWENLLKSEFEIFEHAPLKRYYLKIFIFSHTLISHFGQEDSLNLVNLMSLN